MTDQLYQQLARQYLDLWQKQMSGVFRDKEFIQTMLEMMQGFPHGSEKSYATASSRPARSADDGDGMLDELTFRLSMCERRLAALEGKRAKPVARVRPGKAKSSARARGKKPRR